MRLKEDPQRSAADVPRHLDRAPHLRGMMGIVGVDQKIGVRGSGLGTRGRPNLLKSAVGERLDHVRKDGKNRLQGMAAPKRDLGRRAGVLRVVPGESEGLDFRNRLQRLAFDDVAGLTPRGVVAGAVVRKGLEMVGMVVFAVGDDQCPRAVLRKRAVRLVRLDDEDAKYYLTREDREEECEILAVIPKFAGLTGWYAVSGNHETTVIYRGTK